MCQPRSQGGRRCPLHQPATIGLHKALSAEHGLMPKQIEHTFQGLRTSGSNRPAPTPEEYAYFIQRQKEMLERSRLSDRDKNSVLRQLNKELTESELPDGATFYALKNLRPRTREQKREFVQVIREIANHKGINRNVALAKFKEEYEAQEASGTPDYGSTFDTRTLAAKNSLLGQDAVASDGQPEFSTEPRITRTGTQSTWIQEVGYDPDDGRLEVVSRGREYAYRNVSAAQWEEMNRPRNLGSYISRNIMRNPNHAYASQDEAQRDAYGRWCQDCHKYRAISGHVCDFSAAESREEALSEEIQNAITNTSEADDANSTEDKPSYSYEESLARVKASLGEEPASAPEAEAEETPAPRRQRRRRTGPTARQRRWMVPVEDREVQNFDPNEVPHNSIGTRYDRGFLAPKPSLLRKAVISEGKVATFTIQEQFYGYNDQNGYESFTFKQEMKAYADGEAGNIKFERVNDPQCSCDVYERNGTCTHLTGGVSGSRFSRYPDTPEKLQKWSEKHMNTYHSKVDNGSYLRQKALNEDGAMVFNPSQDRSSRARRGVTFNRCRARTLFSATQKREIKNQLDAGGSVTLEFNEYDGINHRDAEYNNHEFNGKVVLKKDEDGEIAITSNELTCRYCGRYESNPNCSHTGQGADYVKAMVDGRLDAEIVRQREERRSSYGRYSTRREPELDYANLTMADRLRILEEQESSSWLANPEDVEAVQSTFASPTGIDNTYSTNLDRYIADVREAEEKSANGESALPYTKENPTNGICSPESGRAFGIELEFDIKRGVGTSEALAKIGRELHEAGLTATAQQQYYHANRNSSTPYTNWTFEQDCTVDAEIVSPKLHDTPETWDQIEKVCEIVKRNGGQATVRTGGHVHMGLGDGSRSEVARRKVGVTQIYSAFQDSMRRVQANPSRKKHRASVWASPLNESAAQRNIYSIREGGYLHEDHHASLNLGHEGRVEFRGADGSLDPAHIQAQVVVAAGVVSAAERGEYTGDRMRFSKVGDNAKKTKVITKGANRKLTDDELIVSDIEMRKLADTVLNWDAGRRVISGTAANTPWQAE